MTHSVSMATTPPKRRLAETQKLRERMEPLLEPGERLIGAFVAQSGPRTYDRIPWLGLGPFILIKWVLELRHRGERRTWVTIAVTDRSVTIFENGNERSWWSGSGFKRPNRFLRRYDDRTVLGRTGESWGDDWIEVDGKRYWVSDLWLDEARRLSRLTS